MAFAGRFRRGLSIGTRKQNLSGDGKPALMKTYTEQINALKDAIKYKEHECSLLQDIVNQRPSHPIETVVSHLGEKQQELEALRDASTTVIAVSLMKGKVPTIYIAGELFHIDEEYSEVIKVSELTSGQKAFLGI